MHPAHSRAPLLPAPLHGTEARPRALFIDRWGTLLDLPPEGYTARFDPSLLDPGAIDSLFRISQQSWSIYLIGNEEAVARERITEGTWKRFEENLLNHLACYGVRVRRSYACLDDPQRGKGSHKRDSVFLLPNTGAMYHAMQHDDIDLGSSWVIGDSTPELVAGWRAGCHLAGVRTGNGLGDCMHEVEAEVVADHLAAVLRTLMHEDQRA